MLHWLYHCCLLTVDSVGQEKKEVERRDRKEKVAGLDWSLWCSCPRSPESELWHLSVCAKGCSAGHLNLPLWNPIVWMTLTDSNAREAQLYKESLQFDQLAGSWLSRMSLSKALRLKTSLIHLHVGQTVADPCSSDEWIILPKQNIHLKDYSICWLQ